MTSTPASPPPAEIVTALADAARQALRAPSVFNSQPWRWRVGPDTLDLLADRERQLTVTDPDGRLLIISCGAALHHARVALGAAGLRVEVARLPEPGGPDLLARIRVVGRQDPDAEDLRLSEAIVRRRTDRRAFGDTPVSAAALTRLRTAAEANGANLHVVRMDQMPMLAVATAQAAATELADPAYRAELIRWTNRPACSGDGVPASTAVRQAPRRVPVRDYALGAEPGLEVGDGNDRGATYAILFGADDEPAAWLRAGEALSALLLTAVVEGLSAAPLSDAIEQAWPRRLMRDLLAGLGEPYLIVRLGVGADPDGLPPAPRRDPAEVIEFSGSGWGRCGQPSS
ncbi:nitroreductase [Micromonospora orduensis]|uniref:Nitroreductase n=1 Tax=Micromonospora orduensis TaxID=1420891 RepID=A0A5C4QZC8_9ACTN|nr:nitroreductase [Micromonospora orduensis]TNH31133.1 nitroreductase [Micromonospora orduensis]